MVHVHTCDLAALGSALLSVQLGPSPHVCRNFSCKRGGVEAKCMGSDPSEDLEDAWDSMQDGERAHDAPIADVHDADC